MKKGFSLIELLISLIVISIIIAAFAPIMTKKLSISQVALSSTNEITTECETLSEKCELCTKKQCIKCGLESCESGKYINNKKCTCSDCTDWDEKCIECNSKGCTRCATAAYYVKDGKCEPCPTGHYCDGAKDYATCPGAGYYCDATGIHKCSDKYNSACTTCNSSTCLTCTSYYYKTGNTCSPCNMSACDECTSTNYCTKCASDWILNTSTHKCETTCAQAMPGCLFCTNSSTCNNCYGGYYLNTSNTCTKCTISNCQKCVDKRASTSQMCEACKAGYYLLNGACYSCASKFGADCVSCDATQCLSCKQGSTIKTASANPACALNDNKFGCSDSNFMQIGNLCVTRKNMGDSYALTIPSSVTIAQAAGEYCYSTNQKCCWKGQTANSGGCDAVNGGYSGCNRTVCNWSAAKEICEKFNYQGKTWRLATNEEMKTWFTNSSGLGSNGLMLCESASGSNTFCSGSNNCLGVSPPYTNTCEARHVWSGQSINNFLSTTYFIVTNKWSPGSGYKHSAFSVRCVSEM